MPSDANEVAYDIDGERCSGHDDYGRPPGKKLRDRLFVTVVGPAEGSFDIEVVPDDGRDTVVLQMAGSKTKPSAVKILVVPVSGYEGKVHCFSVTTDTTAPAKFRLRGGTRVALDEHGPLVPFRHG